MQTPIRGTTCHRSFVFVVLSPCQSHWLSLHEKTNDLKFQSQEDEALYYLCNEIKGADKLCSYCTADLCLCFPLCKLLVSDAAAHIQFFLSHFYLSQHFLFFFQSFKKTNTKR